MTVFLKVALIGVVTYLAIRKSGPPEPGQGGTAQLTPVMGMPWDLTVPDPHLEGGRLPAVPLTLGGEIVGWYHPVTHKLVAIVNANTKIVVGLTPTQHFPAELP